MYHLLQLSITPVPMCIVVHCFCSALCNDSTLSYQAGAATYQRIGESTELALRVFVEKVGPPLGALPLGAWPSRHTACNELWQQTYSRRAVLEFTRDRWVVGDCRVPTGWEYAMVVHHEDLQVAHVYHFQFGHYASLCTGLAWL